MNEDKKNMHHVTFIRSEDGGLTLSPGFLAAVRNRKTLPREEVTALLKEGTDAVLGAASSADQPIRFKREPRPELFVKNPRTP